ncbi:TlpA disulfide reductase family protein [Pedobacter cryophilus]|uniref:TlpA family protein disulfide reductase n=1 Tax=Pedobacter cryophilus TaxID=2571271 RepID=A0A4U1BX09_9SPHI|nr:TlpA disulfide reductase family protein [Pedobacter cryophilus]TKB97062.1 TlpA family protein disulfide reductase [Pedobacter cryophilus]
MKIKLIFFSLILLVNSKTISAQVKLLSLNQLENRIELGKDTVFVVNFWATWCAPCIKELPNFEQLGRQYQNQPLKVILVSLDFKSKLEKVVNPFVKRNKLKSELYLLNEKSEQDYIDKISKTWSGSLPATLIINNKKKTRNFYEQEFTWEEIEKVYLTNK